MKVQLLGTSAAEGWPALFCRCENCLQARRLGGKNIRTRTTALIDGRIKIDFPPETLSHVVKYNLDLMSLSALLFTHAHDDHCAATELQYLGKYFLPQPVVDRLSIYGPSTTVAHIERAVQVPCLPIDLHTMDAWVSTDIAGYTVTPIEARHDPDQICFNYVIQSADGATLLYAVDTGRYTDRTREYVERLKLDAVVVECANGAGDGEYKGHMGITDVINMREYLVKSGALAPGAPVVTTHHSHLGGLLHDELEERLRPHGITAGFDGMEILVS